MSTKSGSTSGVSVELKYLISLNHFSTAILWYTFYLFINEYVIIPKHFLLVTKLIDLYYNFIYLCIFDIRINQKKGIDWYLFYTG